jgi:engulfment/cell motility protein 1
VLFFFLITNANTFYLKTEVPQREFGRTGVFGLEEMHYFAMNEEDLYSKLILEQIHRPEGKRCPFAKASIEVTDLLCSHWNVSSSSKSSNKRRRKL